MPIVCRTLNKTYQHFLKNFSCGTTKDHEELNEFLKNDSLHHQNNFLGYTHLLVKENKKAETVGLIGFITLASAGIKVEKEKRSFLNLYSNYKQYPAVRIARLAVDEHYQKKGFGLELVQIAIAHILDVNEKRYHSKFIVVDAKDIARNFYIKKLNFRVLDEKKPNVLFFDLKGWSNEPN